MRFAILISLFVPAIGMAFPPPASRDASAVDHVIRVRVAESMRAVRVRGFDLKISERAPAAPAPEPKAPVQGPPPQDKELTSALAPVPAQFGAVLMAAAAAELAPTPAPVPRRPAAAADRVSEWEFDCRIEAGVGRVRARAIGSSAEAAPVELRGSVEVRTPAGFLALQARPYRDTLVIRAVSGGPSKDVACEVVNETDLEKYLDGLVNSEFSAAWNEESIAAQVVAARTYALYQMKKARQDTAKSYDVDSTDRDQVYDGSLKEDYRSSRTVERTRGMVLTPKTSKQDPIKAFYHSTCGGGTEVPERVWGGSFSGFKRVVSCPYCKGSPRFKWEYTVTGAEIGPAIVRGLQALGVVPQGMPAALRGSWRKALSEARLMDIAPAKRSAFGRMAELRTFWNIPGQASLVELRIAASKLRDWTGAVKMRSTFFEVSRSTTFTAGRVDPLFTFKGRGFGHGVGMCQWGAKTMGERGYKLAAILRQYYPDAVLRKLW